MAVGKKGLHALHSRQAHFGEWVSEERPEARYQLLQRARRVAVAAAKNDSQEMKHTACRPRVTTVMYVDNLTLLRAKSEGMVEPPVRPSYDAHQQHGRNCLLRVQQGKDTSC